MIYIALVCVFVVGVILGYNFAFWGLKLIVNQNLSEKEQGTFWRLVAKARGK